MCSLRIVAILLLALSTFQHALSAGDKPPFVGASGQNAWQRFDAQKTHKALAISFTGAWATSTAKATAAEAATDARTRCEKFGTVCLIYAIDDQVVWDTAFERGSAGQPRVSGDALLKKIEAGRNMLAGSDLRMNSRTGQKFATHNLSFKHGTYQIDTYLTTFDCNAGTSLATYVLTENGDIEVKAPLRSSSVIGCHGIRMLLDPVSGIGILYTVDAQGKDQLGPYFYRVLD